MIIRILVPIVSLFYIAGVSAQVTAPITKKPKCTTSLWIEPLSAKNFESDTSYRQTRTAALKILSGKGYKEGLKQISCDTPPFVGKVVICDKDRKICRCYEPIPEYLDLHVYTSYRKIGGGYDWTKPTAFGVQASHWYRPKNDPKYYEITGYYLDQKSPLKPGLSRETYQQQFLEYVRSLPNCNQLELIRAVGRPRN